MDGVVSLGVDPSEVGGGGGRYVATAGRDGVVKVWDHRNWKGAVRSGRVRGGGKGCVKEIEVGWSQRGRWRLRVGGRSMCVFCVFMLSIYRGSLADHDYPHGFVRFTPPPLCTPPIPTQPPHLST